MTETAIVRQLAKQLTSHERALMFACRKKLTRSTAVIQNTARSAIRKGLLERYQLNRLPHLRLTSLGREVLEALR